jgi:DNA-binding transcriptional LysR family regulator
MHSFLPELLKKIKVTFPDVYFILKELDNESQIDALNKGLINIGFVRGPIDLPHLKAQLINTSTFSIVLANSHPLAKKQNLSLQDLKNTPFIRFSKKCAPPFYKSLVSIFRKNNIEAKTVHETSQIYALLKLVENGFGYSIVPTDLKSYNNMDLSFHELNDHTERTEIVALYNEKSVNKLTKSIINEMINLK